MENISKSFQKILKSKNPEELNDFLVKLSEDPSDEYLNFIDYLINNLELQILEKIKLNLIFFLGELGKVVSLDQKYLEFLSETYYKSDRWVRREIIQTFYNISKKTKLTKNIIELVGYALNDDYIPIKVNTQKVLLNLDALPKSVLENLFRSLNSKESEMINYSSKIFEKHFKDSKQIFTSLNESGNYMTLKKHGVRTLLLICFKSLINLEALREMILSSNWPDTSKKIYLKEIETYESILLKNL